MPHVPEMARHSVFEKGNLQRPRFVRPFCANLRGYARTYARFLSYGEKTGFLFLHLFSFSLLSPQQRRRGAMPTTRPGATIRQSK